MKKATAILSALLVAVMMMAASVCAAEINLIPEDADWVMTEAGGSGASWSYGENGLPSRTTARAGRTSLTAWRRP